MKRGSSFQPPRWLRSRHLQTILPNSPLRRTPVPNFEMETMELPDGDFVRLAWLRSDGPIVLLLHGLEGSVESRYARSVMQALAAAGCTPVMMHFRGCGGARNRLDRSYHAGDTGDIAHVLEQLCGRYPQRPIAALGYSLGGNVLLKYLGEHGADALVRTAIAVSVPFDLQDACSAVSQGFSRLYQHILMRRMKRTVREKFTAENAPFDYQAALRARRFDEFDEVVTAPMHGFASATDYYRRASSRAFLKSIRRPTLIVHAADDPFMSPASIPRPHELSDAVVFELSEYGGHVGFLQGASPWSLSCWLEQRILNHLAEFLDLREDSDAPDAAEPVSAAG